MERTPRGHVNIKESVRGINIEMKKEANRMYEKEQWVPVFKMKREKRSH